jgi:putative flavoprotein involved in K+ transport
VLRAVLVVVELGGVEVPQWAQALAREDAIVLATGYRPNPGCLAPLGTLGAAGHPRHRAGMSLTHPGMAHVGREWRRSRSSHSLRGVGSDAARAARRIAAYLSRA